MTHIAQQSRQEKRERLDCDVDCEEAERADRVVDVEDRTLDVVHLDLLVDVGAVLAVQALGSNLLLPRSKELAVFGMCLHEDGSGKTDKASEKAFEEKDVTPGVQSHGGDTELRDLRETCSQQTSECTSQRTGRNEDSNTEEQLTSLVETRQEESNTGHSATLSKTKDCSCGIESLPILDERCAKRDQTESEDQEWEPKPWTDCLEDDVAGNFDADVMLALNINIGNYTNVRDVSEVKDGQCPVESVTSKFELFLHSLDSCISYEIVSNPLKLFDNDRIYSPMFARSRKHSR